VNVLRCAIVFLVETGTNPAENKGAIVTKYKHKVGRQTYTISLHKVLGACCWAVVCLGRRRIGETRDLPYGMTGVAYEQAVQLAETHAAELAQ
jgi:hypothetical protein